MVDNKIVKVSHLGSVFMALFYAGLSPTYHLALFALALRNRCIQC